MGAYGSPDLFPYKDSGSQVEKKQLYKKPWFWIVLVFCVVLFFAGGANASSFFAVGLCVSVIGGLIALVQLIISLFTKKARKKKLKACGLFAGIFFASVVIYAVVSPKIAVEPAPAMKAASGEKQEANPSAGNAETEAKKEEPKQEEPKPEEQKQEEPKPEDPIEMTEEEKILAYKDSAEIISYEELLRNPDNYTGHVMYVDLKVRQVLVGGIITESGYAGTEGGDEWYVHYDLPKGASRILEGDTVRFYGEFTGLSKMKRALTGVTELIPRLDAKYVE